MSRCKLVALISILMVAVEALPAQRKKPVVPDLTAGGQADDKHDWNLGPTGARGWIWGYRNLFLCEYYLATRDEYVLPAIRAYSSKIAEGQSGVGTWGHGMAWPDLNRGRLHGSLGGYGALNQAGLVCHLSLVLARKCGIDHKEIGLAIERANRFAAFYVGKGAIPYGDHRPGWQVHDDNGKNSIAALIFDLQDLRAKARFFAKMTAASYAERERGHTGNYFSFLWGPLGVARAGPAAAAAFLEEQRWYYDLARCHDGSFLYQGGAGMAGGEHKYGDWDCTGAFVLASALPLRKLYITGKGTCAENAIEGAELGAVIAAGRGFDSWDMARGFYERKPSEKLRTLLRSWSPAVRHRAAQALAKSAGDHVPHLLRLLRSQSLDARYGACKALGALGRRADAAAPALTATLTDDDVWLRIQAAYALSHIGPPARVAVPAMLRLAVQHDPEDQREFTQRYLSFCLFYPGGALKMTGLLARSLDGVDRELLYPAVKRLLQNDDGRARGALATVYDNLSLEEIAPLLPAILRAIEEPAPSGVMFASGIRLSGLELLARHRFAEGIRLCLEVMDIDTWGKRNRIDRCLKILAQYGGAARPVLRRLRDLEAKLMAHREAKGLSPQIELCRQTMAGIQAATDAAPLRHLSDFNRPDRRQK